MRLNAVLANLAVVPGTDTRLRITLSAVFSSTHAGYCGSIQNIMPGTQPAFAEIPLHAPEALFTVPVIQRGIWLDNGCVDIRNRAIEIR